MTASDWVPDDPARRLATYGSLIPGGPDYHHVSDVGRRWTTGFVTGHLHEEGWGAAIGCPAITLAPDGDRVDVHVPESGGLPAHRDRLDEFEGAEYARKSVTVQTAAGEVAASVCTRRRSCVLSGSGEHGL